ncbi:bifunctional homocysteine S-methyltransferase/methylenetetrahydrofolate reductase [bacterium D16-51]|nr:bifunctional homocysteine S-methyltransferase/methylenetetrahydrofolate reductase [bacterium D16-59]RKI58938.1 bifunctional homocysteine S-methyltransferase/methylenetetrahydrofolate reductase [bacterium D16-51]
MDIREYLEKKPLLFDGAMGTYLAKKYQELDTEPCEMMNLLHPELVLEVHKEYIKAGAVAVKTNTFSANCEMLKEDRAVVEEVIREGFRLARRTASEAGREVFVFADIGPVPEHEGVDASAAYREIADVFLACHAECFLFETMADSEAAEACAAYIKERSPEAFVMVSFAASPEGYTRGGFLAKKLFWGMQQSEAVDAVGFNCISGPKHLLELVKKLPKEQVKKYLTVMPNAGYPTMVGNRIYYGTDRRYFGQAAYDLLQEGVSIVGGCCGTTPEDIAQVQEKIQVCEKEWAERRENGQKTESPGKGKVLAKGQEGTQESQMAGGKNIADAMENPGNSFAEKLRQGKKVLVVELDPPVEPDIDFFMEGAARYQLAGVDAIDIADCPVAKARIDSSILACKVSRELGLTAIPHMTCRDRNINATKALLLGLNMEGVNNVLAVTGDPVPTELRNQVKTVFGYNSAVLARHIQSFNEEIFCENPFMVSGALNINALNFDFQLSHAKSKIENGMSVLFTQPVLSERGFENLKRARKELDVKLLGGIMPVVSYRNAAFMNSEMAGIEVTPEIMEQYRGKNREEGEELAFKISAGVIREISEYIDGYYLITPFKRVELVLRIISYIRNC